MLFERVNRDDPEKIFIIVKNSYATLAMTNGMAVQWDFLTDVDGVGVSIPTARATNAGLATAGIIAETIAIGDYGLCQTYGYHASVIFRSGTGTSLAGALGSAVILRSRRDPCRQRGTSVPYVSSRLSPKGDTYQPTA